MDKKESKSSQPSGMEKNSREVETRKRKRKGIPRRSPLGHTFLIPACSDQTPFEPFPDQGRSCSDQKPLEPFPHRGQLDVMTGGNGVMHAVYVHPGEDIISRVASFVQKSHQDVYILSAVGIVSHARIHCCGQTSNHEGSYEIVSLKGYVTAAIMHDDCTGNDVFVSLAKPGNSVFYGAADSLVAASPIQLVLVEL